MKTENFHPPKNKNITLFVIKCKKAGDGVLK